MGKKSLIKSTSKKKSGDTNSATKKETADAAKTAQPAQPAKAEKAKSKSASTRKKSTAATKSTAVKKAAQKKTATKKKTTTKKSAAKKKAAKPAAKKKAATTAKKPTRKKSTTKKESTKPAAKKVAAKKATPKKSVVKKETTKPPVVVTTLPPDKKAVAVKEPAKPPVEVKTTPLSKSETSKATPPAEPEMVKKPPTKTTPSPQEATSQPPEKSIEAPPAQPAAAQKDAEGPSSKPAAPSAETPQFTQPPPRPEPSPEEKVEVSYEKPLTPEKRAAAPMSPMIKYGTIGLAFLILLVLGASVTNSKRYYVIKRPLDVEIWKGEFSPMGKEQIAKISGVALPEESKAVYSRNDVYPLVFQYHLNHADALLESSASPDYDAIKVLINRAQNYAVTPILADQANRRLTAIDLHHLIYKAGIDAEKATIEGYEKALGYLNKAKKLKLDKSQLAMVDHKITEMKDALARIEVEKSVKEIMTAPSATEMTEKH